jgi:PPOX class probable F420-dependent enzyme
VARIPLPEAARELLDSDAVAHVVTIDEDGGPHVTAAWIGTEGDEIVLATLPDQRKLRNLRRDPRIALSVPSTRRNEWGLLEYLVVYGTARVTEGGAAEMLQRLAHTYLGPDVVFPGMPDLRRDSLRGSRPNGSGASGRGTHPAASSPAGRASIDARGRWRDDTVVSAQSDEPCRYRPAFAQARTIARIMNRATIAPTCPRGRSTPGKASIKMGSDRDSCQGTGVGIGPIA